VTVDMSNQLFTKTALRFVDGPHERDETSERQKYLARAWRRYLLGFWGSIYFIGEATLTCMYIQNNTTTQLK